MQQNRFSLDIRKNSLAVGIVSQWNRLPREVVASPFIVGFPREDWNKHWTRIVKKKKIVHHAFIQEVEPGSS